MYRRVRVHRQKTSIWGMKGPASGSSWIWTLNMIHHAIITKLPAVSWRIRGLDQMDVTLLSQWPPPHTSVRLSTYESCAAKDHLTITAVSVTQDQGGSREQKWWEGKSTWYIASQVIWSYVWQWAVGFWNVSRLHLHIASQHLNILVCKGLLSKKCILVHNPKEKPSVVGEVNWTQ